MSDASEPFANGYREDKRWLEGEIRRLDERLDGLEAEMKPLAAAYNASSGAGRLVEKYLYPLILIAAAAFVGWAMPRPETASVTLSPETVKALAQELAR